MKRLILLLGIVGFGTGLVSTGVLADQNDAAGFYKGRQIKMIIRSSPGGSFDTFARLLSRHMGRHIPGNPTFIDINMPGASGIKAANYVVDVAPRDGSIVANVSFAFPMEQAMGVLGKVDADMRDFNWIGSFNATNQVLVVMKSSPTKTLEEAKRRETLVGAATPVSASAYLPRAFNVLLGTKFKVVVGYQGIPPLKLAMERGEVEGLGADGWSDLKSDFQEFMENNRLNVLLQIGMKKEADLPNVPLLIDQAQTPQDRAVLEFITKGNSSLGKPFATSPGVPAARVALLRRAFDATMIDEDFLADARKNHVKIDPVSGKALQQLVADILSATPAVIGKANAALGLAEAEKKHR